jgi:salicylate hydroxylase
MDTGRAMLIGDAAESLRLLAPGTRREDIQEILKLAESVRRSRTAQVLAETRKSHSTLGVAENAIRNLEFNCSYDGIHKALKARQGEADA